MATSATCSICGQEDSWRHSLIDCNFARCVWALTDEDITEHIALSTEPAARQWIFSMIETMKKGDLIRMLVTLWAIWHARRKAIHEDVFQSPMATISFVNRFLADLEGCGRPVKWTAPPEGVTKINVDAAVAKIACKGTIGVVCRSRWNLPRCFSDGFRWTHPPRNARGFSL
jgi:hypothetical protein